MSVRDGFKSWPASTILVFILLVIGAWSALSIFLGVRLWSWVTGVQAPGGPFSLLDASARGTFHPTAGLWWCVAVAGLVLVLIPTMLALAISGGPNHAGRQRGDEAASRTGRRRETSSLEAKAVRAKAKRLGVETNGVDTFGLPIGRAVAGKRSFWSSFEDVCVLIAGPRTGKTTCWVVPRIWAAPGLVVATSNKRDIVDSSRNERAGLGNIWIFDPQAIVGEPQKWWWNILTYVTDAVQATALAQIFVDTTRDATAQKNAYFDSASQELIASLLLAAARGGHTIIKVYDWLRDPDDREPLRILRGAGEERMALSLEGNMNLVHETRSGVYGGAGTIVRFMVNDEAMKWVTPQHHLPELQIEDLIRSTDTLYCLSQEGRGSATPIVTALTVAVTEAAVELAKTQPGGRLRTPMLIELDEAANVCRWSELPNQYSHFGSRGIVVDTVLQNWSQGEVVWGKEGMRKLWSAANQRVYGGGVSEKDYLSDLETVIGAYYIDSTQSSYSAQSGSSTSRSHESQQRWIATVAELAALPPRRAWLMSSGNTAVLIEMMPFYESKPPKYTNQRPRPTTTTTITPSDDNVLTNTAALPTPWPTPAPSGPTNPWVTPAGRSSNNG